MMIKIHDDDDNKDLITMIMMVIKIHNDDDNDR